MIRAGWDEPRRFWTARRWDSFSKIVNNHPCTLNNELSMQDLNDLYYFVQIVEHGGFAPAGRALNTPKSKLSCRFAALEERLGVRLIQRSSRRFSVTDIGQTYYEHCKAMLVEAEAAQAAIEMTRAEPQGLLRVNCPQALLSIHVEKILADFLALYPRVNLHLEMETTNRQVDPLEEGFDIAVSRHPPSPDDSSLSSCSLSDRGQCLVASPDLLERMGWPTQPTDLEVYPTLALGGRRQHCQWELFADDGASVRVKHSPRYTASDTSALHQAVICGVGVGQFPLTMVLDELADGSLVRVLPEWSPQPEAIYAIFPTRRGLLSTVRTLVDFLAEHFAALEVG
ncbi:LysR substrate-binding domain-containing protein [Microbulbifer rhizosphaerae]|uniref:DNA-binding transcriptional LysR family regulator n=1 Tax=Microbulbifer rhizosphaerae TaxID=1562603 RepID=A0A7W4WAD9_9GAMM|nr:LysR substrate-binding domain-containing protein [Microbulbifer rhizosphaerae]MBB3060083.1 DNA-binding transcriptional LysR family regulator [Microbulbifer rhizosphaerae]